MNYSSDEIFALGVGLIIGLISWSAWYFQLAVTGTRVRSLGSRWPLSLVMPFCAFVLYVVLKFWSADDVRNDPDYMLFYMVIGMGWVGLLRTLLPAIGLSPRDDVLERGNDATCWATVGALLGSTFCFAGANVGNGPGWWVVIFSSLLSTGALLFLWLGFHRLTGVQEQICVERDTAAGLRAAGFFIGNGLILGRAVVGDWVSASATVADFARMAWPALILSAIVAAIELKLPRTYPAAPSNTLFRGVLPCLTSIVLGAIVVFAL